MIHFDPSRITYRNPLTREEDRLVRGYLAETSGYPEDLGESVYETGETVWYDDTSGVVLERLPSAREGSYNYRVAWEDGITSVVWGSDLVRDGEQR